MKTITKQFNIPADQQQKAFAQAEIFINAPVDKVYNVLTNIDEWPLWQQPVRKSKVNGTLAEQTTFDWVANGMAIHSKLHTVIPNEAIGWTGRMKWIKAIHNWQFEAKDEGCLVKVEESMSGLFSGLFKSTLENGMQQNLSELKAEVEARGLEAGS